MKLVLLVGVLICSDEFWLFKLKVLDSFWSILLVDAITKLFEFSAFLSSNFNSVGSFRLEIVVVVSSIKSGIGFVELAGLGVKLVVESLFASLE